MVRISGALPLPSRRRARNARERIVFSRRETYQPAVSLHRQPLGQFRHIVPG